VQRILRLKNLSPAATGRGAGGPASKTVVIAYGFWLFLLSDIVLFSCLFAAHAVLQTAIADGPAEHELFKPTNIAIETAYLPPIPAQAEQKIGVEGDRCLRLRFRLDQRIAHAVLERVARAVSRGRVFDVGMRLHHHAAGANLAPERLRLAWTKKSSALLSLAPCYSGEPVRSSENERTAIK
jgi:hypothetical protein